MGEGTTTCPRCGAVVPAEPGYTPWCDCGWNLEPPASSEPRNVLERAYAALGARHGESLFQELVRHGAARPRTSPSGAALVALSVVTIAVSLVLVVGGLLLVRVADEAPMAWFGVVVALLLALVLRPRREALPDVVMTTPSSHPQLHALVARVAAAVGTEPPAILALTSDFNAFVTRAGWRRRRTLCVGLPFLAALGPQETVAVVSHEMAHLVNGDTTRGVLVGEAVRMLESWCVALAPPRTVSSREHVIYYRLGMLWMQLTSLLPRTALQVIVRLAWMRSQRAEYYADRLGASVSGTPAFTGLLLRALDGDALEAACHRVVVAGKGTSVTDELRSIIEARPPRERERRRRRAMATASSLDGTHPPTGMRLRLLESRPHETARVVLSAEDHTALRAELDADMRRCDQDLAGRWLSRLHG